MHHYRRSFSRRSNEAVVGYALLGGSRTMRGSACARELMGDGDNDVYLSAASSWEIAIKISLRKLTLPEPPEQYVPGRLAAQGMQGLAIEHAHALRVASLPPHHKDPFDRLIIAQALVEKIPILTADENFGAYDVEAIWAGRGEAPWTVSG